MIDLERNREEFINLIKTNVKRVSTEQIDYLINFLDTNGFFSAPASTKYHSCFDGGLCWHSLCVYKRFNELAKDVASDETTVIISLLHDFDKMFNYCKTAKNEKVYSENGSKCDELGRFDWVSKMSWTRRDVDDRFVFGTHGQNCAYLLGKFIPLTDNEYSAVLNHMGGMEDGSAPSMVLTDVFGKNKLAILLHTADMLATYVDETKNPEDVVYKDSFSDFVFYTNLGNLFTVGQVIKVEDLGNNTYRVGDSCILLKKHALLEYGRFGTEFNQDLFDKFVDEQEAKEVDEMNSAMIEARFG